MAAVGMRVARTQCPSPDSSQLCWGGQGNPESPAPSCATEWNVLLWGALGAQPKQEGGWLGAGALGRAPGTRLPLFWHGDVRRIAGPAARGQHAGQLCSSQGFPYVVPTSTCDMQDTLAPLAAALQASRDRDQ